MSNQRSQMWALEDKTAQLSNRDKPGQILGDGFVAALLTMTEVSHHPGHIEFLLRGDDEENIIPLPSHE